MIKAFMVYSGDPFDGCILVFADGRGKAKSMCVGHSFDWEYLDMSCVRRQDFDKYGDECKIIDDNEALPDGVEFYGEIRNE